MDVDECIEKRRSVRAYKPRKVEQRKIEDILDSIRYAPSAGNMQSWRLILVRDEDRRAKLADSCLQQPWIEQAPVLIVVCEDIEDTRRTYGKRAKPFCACSSGAIIEHILLKAHSLGLGSCWVGSFDDEAIKRILKIPDEINVQAVITIGYSDEENKMDKRLQSREFTFFEEWGSDKIVSDSILGKVKKMVKR